MLQVTDIVIEISDMQHQDHIEIPLNRRKILMLFLLCTTVVVFTVPHLLDFINQNIYMSTLVLVAVIFAVIVCGFGVLLSLYFLFDKKTKLIINREGINADTIGGLVLWSDIQDIRMIKIHIGYIPDKYLVIVVKNPQEFIDKKTIELTLSDRKAMEANLRWFGGPVYIVANHYQMSSKKLHSLLLEKLKESQKVNVW